MNKLAVVSKNAVSTLTRFGSRALLKVKKYSPEILMGVGTVAVVAGVVQCCRSTIKAASVAEEFAKDRADIQQAKEAMEAGKLTDYTPRDYQMDIVKLYVQTGVKYARKYALGATLVASGVACYFGAYGILHARNVALTAAYASLQEAYDRYRETVKERFGEKADSDIQEEMATEYNDNLQPIANPANMSPYARIFDESNDWWRPSAEHNKNFITMVQNQMNDRLRRHGHVFLNEVYESLGFDHTKAGCVVGWVLNNPDGNGYIDFGLYDGKERHNRFVNCDERSVWLDFNVDGVVYDMI